MKPRNNIHDVSIESVADATSFEKEPDIFINHVATTELPEPKSQDRKYSTDYVLEGKSITNAVPLLSN